MRPFLLAIAALLLVMPTPQCLAAELPLNEQLKQARRELDLAKRELWHYRRVELPRLQRRIDHELRVVKLEIDMLKRRVREYERFHRNRTSRPFLVSLEYARVALLDAELQYADLQADRSALVRFRTPRDGELAARVEATRARVVQLDRLLYGD